MEKKFIYVISDIHMQFYYYQEIIPENIDLLIIAGDLLTVGNRDEANYACIFLDGLKEDKNINEIIWVLGNHDVSVTNDLEYYRLQYPGIQFKIKDEFVWNGYKFFVTGYSPFVQNRWTNYFTNQLEEQNVMVPSELPDIIISHCPPSHKDFSYVVDSGTDIGSNELRKYIEENKVKYTFCGHLHFDYSDNQNEYIEINGCQCYNVTSKGKLLSLQDGNIKLEHYTPSISDRTYWKCRKNGAKHDHIGFMKFIELWEAALPISEEYYKIKWTASGIRFIDLPEYELEKVREFFLEHYGRNDHIQNRMLYKFN